MSKFPLARLMRLRQISADRAAQDFALAQRRSSQADAKSQRAQANLFGTSLEVPGAVWQAVVAARTATTSMAAEAAAAAAAAGHEAQDFSAKHDQARQVVKPLEKLEEKFIQTSRAQEEAQQSVVLDEIGQNIYLARRDNPYEL